MELSVTNQQSAHPVDEDRILLAARTVLADSEFMSGSVNVAIVDDTTMRELNRRHLSHDWSTDVLSFVLDQQHDFLQGEVVISADTAVRQAPEYGWSADKELLLYVIHGVLHLVGYRDKTAADATEMRAAETTALRQIGIERPTADTAAVAMPVSKNGGSPAS